jgi:DNA-binding CsgD family transcriptional regulator
MKILREYPETARAGLKWDEEESQELMNRIKDGMSLEDIANTHKRTVSGVKNRIMTNALNIMKEKKISLDEVSKLVNISVFDLKNYKEKIDKKKSDKKESDNLSS